MILVNDVTQFGDVKLLMGLSLVGCHICGLKLLFNAAQMCPVCEAKLFLTIFPTVFVSVYEFATIILQASGWNFRKLLTRATYKYVKRSTCQYTKIRCARSIYPKRIINRES